VASRIIWWGDALSGKSIGILRDLKQALDNAIKSPFFRDGFVNATQKRNPLAGIYRSEVNDEKTTGMVFYCLEMQSA
jgi:hypothetical protein